MFRQMVMPDWGVPHLHDWFDQRLGFISTRNR